MKPTGQEVGAGGGVRAPRSLSAVARALALAVSALIAGCASTFDGDAARAMEEAGHIPQDGARPGSTAARGSVAGQEGLAGQGPVILSVSSGRPIPPAEWAWQLRHAPVVLLGEVHDNRQHHELRARLLRIWADGAGETDGAGRPAIVFEFFDRQRRAGLFALTDRPPAERPDLDALLDAAGFNRQGWRWPAHEPLFTAAREVDASWIAAGIFRPMTSAGASPSVPDAADRQRLDAIVAAADWPATAAAALDTALIDGHCGRLPERALPAMISFQRSRDASLAEPILNAPPGRRTLVLAGNGHVGRSHGVPRYLGPLAMRAISVGFVERGPGAAPGPDDNDRAEYDWIVVTGPVADRGDPCEAFNPPAPKQTPGR